MKKRTNGILGILVLASLVVMALEVGPAIAGAVQPSFDVTESSVYHDEYGGYYTLSFTVNNGYSDIYEFAIGNNDAQWAWVDDEASNPPASLTKGRIVYKKEDNKWYTWDNRHLEWLDNAMGFENYTAAFLYTSWDPEDNDYTGYLETGITNGYEGSTLMPMSPFAAYSQNSGTITGQTSPVPIPGAVWLLGSGLVGFGIIMQKKKILA